MVNDDVSPRPGEQVFVPWGLEELLGEVVEVYTTGLGDRAVVRVIGGPDPDMTVTVNADSLTPASGHSRGMSARADAFSFQARIDSIIKAAVGELRLSLVHHERLDRGADAVISDGAREVAIQIKFSTQKRLSSDAVAVLAAYASSDLPFVIIANVGLSVGASERLKYNNRIRQTIWFVRWTGGADNVLIKDSIRQALSSV